MKDNLETDSAARKRVLILGGGFGGIYAAQRLGRTLGKRQDIEVMLISRENYLLFTPMLHEVAGGDLEPGDIVNSLRKMARNVRLVQGEVTGIDLAERTVWYDMGALRQPRVIHYDYLLLALGSETHFFGMKDVEESATTMKSLADAALLRNGMIASLEEAVQETDDSRRRRLMTFVVAGGGFAGVETAGAINGSLRHALRYYPELDESMLRVVLVHPGPVVLPELPEPLGRYTATRLERAGVELWLETRVTGYDGDAVSVSAGGPLHAASLIWAAGNAPAAVLAPLEVEKFKGRVRVNERLEVTGHEGVVWAVGDCAAVPHSAGFHPPTAQHGMREAVVAAKNIEAVIAGKAQAPFRFTMIGQLASIGRRTGVAQIFGLRFSGFAAWWLWRTVYLAKLPGLSKKLRVAIKWSSELLFPREIEQLVTLQDVERIEKLGGTLRARRGGVASPDAPDPDYAAGKLLRRPRVLKILE
jgi:NADH dehydrogenase